MRSRSPWKNLRKFTLLGSLKTSLIIWRLFLAVVHCRGTVSSPHAIDSSLPSSSLGYYVPVDGLAEEDSQHLNGVHAPAIAWSHVLRIVVATVYGWIWLRWQQKLKFKKNTLTFQHVLVYFHMSVFPELGADVQKWVYECGSPYFFPLSFLSWTQTSISNTCTTLALN